MKKAILTLFLTLIANLSLAANIDDIRWVGQDYPPFIYIDGSGQHKGVLVDLVGKILKKTGSSKTVEDIEIRTFSKMFMFSNNKENAVFFPLARTKDREDYFKWVGPIFINEPVVFAKGDHKIDSIKDLTNYTILGREKYTGVTQLQNAGISVSLGNSDQENWLKLKNEEVQMIVCDKTVGQYWIKQLSLPANEYKIVYALDTNEMDFAFNKDTDDDLVSQVKEALKTTKMQSLH